MPLPPNPLPFPIFEKPICCSQGVRKLGVSVLTFNWTGFGTHLPAAWKNVNVSSFFYLVRHQRNITILSIHPWRGCQLLRCQELDQSGEHSWMRMELYSPLKSTGSSSRWKKIKECLLSGYNNNVELVRGMLGVFIMLCRIGANITCLNNKMLYSKKRRRKKVKIK